MIAHSSDGVDVGWLRLSPVPSMESGVDDDEEGDWQAEDADAEAGRGVTSVAMAPAVPVPLTLCGDSSLISIWFFLGPVEMFWMLNWLNEDESEEAAGSADKDDGKDGAGAEEEEGGA